MARCTGGPSQTGAQKSGRMHLNGDEDNCAKHQSDNFSFMSTVFRVAARDQRLHHAQPPIALPGVLEADQYSDTETERATSLPSTIPETVARSFSLDSTSQVDNARERSRSLPDDREDVIPIVLEALDTGSHPPYPFSFSFRNAAFFLLVTVTFAYAYYRWFYRAEFRYQNQLLRELYGLQRSERLWF